MDAKSEIESVSDEESDLDIKVEIKSNFKMNKNNKNSFY